MLITARQLAELVVSIEETKPKPDPSCERCKGSGLDTYDCHHTGNTYKATCDCVERPLKQKEQLLDQSLYSNLNQLYKICKYYLDNTKKESRKCQRSDKRKRK